MKGALSILAVIFLAASATSAITDKQDKQDRRDGLSPATIKTVVERRLIKEGIQRDGNVEVSVDDGIVTLKGKVRSYAEKRKAERAARGVDDVMSVENKLEVEVPSHADQQLADEIAKQIRSFVFFDIFDWVEGEVHDGVVTLRGAVREPWRREDYERLAESVEGVKEVRNEIRVLPTSIYDDQLRIAAARLIYGDPRFARYANRALRPIHIIVENGRITLKGAVANQLERQLIEAKIRSGVLAFDVVNDLKVDEQAKN